MVTTFTRLLLLASAIALSGCATNPQALPPQTFANAREFTWRVRPIVASGATYKVGFFTNLRPDCTLESLPTIRTLTEPANGKLQVTQTEDVPLTGTAGPLAKCSSVRVKGLRVTYKSQPGYIGTDDFAFDLFNGSGLRHFHVSPEMR
jgi:hypothetical protein